MPSSSSSSSSNPETSTVPDDVPDVEEVTSTGVKRTPWTDFEDTLLCDAWVEVSTEAEIGTDRSGDTFWEGIHKLYHKTKDSHLPDENEKLYEDRTQAALTNRFGTINAAVSTFYGCYKSVQALKPSGANPMGLVT